MFVAFALSLPVAWDRERGDRSAGLRTFPLVATAAAGYVLLAQAVFPGEARAQARVLEGVITGVGRVVWKRDLGQANDSLPAGMGIKFIKMDPESRSTVEKIVNTRGDAPASFEEGGGDGETEEAPAAPFFPDLPPAELPKPEDRTVIRQAQAFLDAALGEAQAPAGPTAPAHGLFLQWIRFIPQTEHEDAG